MRNKPAKNTSGNHSLLRQMAAQKKQKLKHTAVKMKKIQQSTKELKQ